MATPTIHNPTHFEPSSYEVVDYFDNKRPAFYGQSAEEYAAELDNWKESLIAAYGADYASKIHRCVHCHNGNVRWITAVLHLPTNEVVTFGSDCTARLGFRNKFAFKLAQLQAKAEAGHAKMKVWQARVAFLEKHPQVAAAVEQAKNPIHAKNFFVQDVLSKLNLYGSLSERQVSAVLSSIARDIQTASYKAQEAVEVKGAAPSGKQTVTGVVLSTKRVEGLYGIAHKMLVKLDNNAKIWVTVPSKVAVERNDTVTVTATFEVSKDDAAFAFGSRPTVTVQEAVA